MICLMFCRPFSGNGPLVFPSLPHEGRNTATSGAQYIFLFAISSAVDRQTAGDAAGKARGPRPPPPSRNNVHQPGATTGKPLILRTGMAVASGTNRFSAPSLRRH